VVVSPFARRHFVSHVVYDHTSILRFIELRFDLPALTRRDANADPMLELFDFTDPPFRDPPQLDPPQLDQDRFDQCAEKPATGSG
jgi:phospholipase C